MAQQKELYEKTKVFLKGMYGNSYIDNSDDEETLKYYEIKYGPYNPAAKALCGTRRVYPNKDENYYNLNLKTTLEVIHINIEKCKKEHRQGDFDLLENLIKEHKRIELDPVGKKLDILIKKIEASKKVTSGGVGV